MFNKELAARLLKSRFQPPHELRRALEAPTRAAAAQRRPRQRRQPPQYAKGVVNGQFVRVRVPGRDPPSKLKKLYSPSHPPVKPFAHPVTHSEAPPTIQEFAEATRAERKEFFEEYWDRLKEWIKLNRGVLVLNFGSVCSLIAFTRSDVLELRALSVVGSASYVLYFFALPGPPDWTPILWSFTFIAVNGQKIYEILVERKGSAEFTAEQEMTYTNYFQPHGVTRKQFEYIHQKARTIHLKKGDVLVREGDQMKDVFLVTSGKTRAHHLGRRLTAVSYTAQPKVELRGGTSGAWVGEMAFFEQDWQKHDDEGNDNQGEGGQSKATPRVRRRETPTGRAMYTIVAEVDDTTVLAWSHDDMQTLLDRSADMRAALTRAMTAAIVSKVVGFTHSRKAASASPWSSVSWLNRLWPWSRDDDEDEDEEERAVVETSEPHKVEVKDKPIYQLADAKNCPS